MKLHRRKKKVESDNVPETSIKYIDFFKSPHINVNKGVVDYYGIDIALWIGDIYSRWEWFRKQGKIDEKGFIFTTQKEIRETTKLNYNKQTDIIKRLVEDKILEVKRIGLPARNHYRINLEILIDIIKGDKIFIRQRTRSLKSKDDNKNKYNNILSKDNNYNTNKNKISSKDDIRLSDESLSASQPENPPHKDSRLLQNRKIAYSKDVERLFDFWNGLGPPLTSHRRDTKTYHNSCKILLTTLETNPLKRIMTSMLNYHDLITDPSNNIAHKASIGLPGCKVNLIEFFGFDKRTKEAMKLRKINLPIKSWFDECVKNKSPALEKKFGMFIEDPYPDISDRFRKLWFKKMGVGKINATGENKIRKAAVMFNDFMAANLDSMVLGTSEKRHSYELVDYVFQAIDGDVKGDWLVVTVGWLCSKRTYDIRLPLHLSRLGILEREEKEDKKDVDDDFSIYGKGERNDWKRIYRASMLQNETRRVSEG
ncbi:hypothetical protein LCGC14_1567190 [marine sediment metagenome]|uniref:Uncharacterized protein n=1 Tax=marine sediment metagenome TaxID=412755 RepID=A0A0F9LLA6_9ZZZZ